MFCYTEKDRERLRDGGVSSLLEVVHNGIDVERFRPDGERNPQVRAAGPVALFVGRLVEGKRSVVTVEAMTELREEFSDAELYGFGKGPVQNAVLNRGTAPG